MSEQTITKICRVGEIISGKRKASIFVKITINDGKLSIAGVEGPLRNGDAIGSCGQIHGGYAHRNSADNDQRYTKPITPDQIAFAPRWTPELWLDLLDIWERWHLNDMRAGCEHQRAEGWDKRPIDPTKPTTAYGKHFPGQSTASWNMLTWISRSEHPQGLLSEPCPVCGYKYGTRWLREELPDEVVEFVKALPDADQSPAWV